MTGRIKLNDIQPGDKLSDNITGAELLRASTWDKPESTINSALFPIFELLRQLSGGRSAKIHSAFRNFIPAGGSKNSAHLRGNAFDVHLDAEQKKELLANLRSFLVDARGLGLKGFAMYDWGVHIDVDDFLPVSWYWGKESSANDGESWTVAIRHWGQDIGLKKQGRFTGSVQSEDEKKNPPKDAVGHEDEQLRYHIKKALPIAAVSITLALLTFVYLRFKK